MIFLAFIFMFSLIIFACRHKWDYFEPTLLSYRGIAAKILGGTIRLSNLEFVDKYTLSFVKLWWHFQLFKPFLTFCAPT